MCIVYRCNFVFIVREQVSKISPTSYFLVLNNSQMEAEAHRYVTATLELYYNLNLERNKKEHFCQ